MAVLRNKGPARAYLMNMTTGSKMEFQFNPPEFMDIQGVEYAMIDSPGVSRPSYQYVRGGEREISFEMFVDAYEDNTYTEVTDKIDFLQSFIPSGTIFNPPPKLLFGYGSFIKECIVRNIEVNYTMFNKNLTPIRATINLSLVVVE